MMIKKNKRKIIVVTGSRADYGLLKEILKKLNNDDFFDLKIVVTGSHLLKNYGSTFKNIKKGELFTKDNITFKRASRGISPIEIENVLGRVAKKNFSKDELIKL